MRKKFFKLEEQFLKFTLNSRIPPIKNVPRLREKRRKRFVNLAKIVQKPKMSLDKMDKMFILSGLQNHIGKK